MKKIKNNYDYLKDLSDQVRSEIGEFYKLNTAFVLANSFLASIVSRLKEIRMPCWTLIIFILINMVWFYLILLSNKWFDYWMSKARREADRMGRKAAFSKNCGFVLLGISVRKFFYFLPFLFSVLFLIIGYYQTGKEICTPLVLFIIMISMGIAGLVSIRSKEGAF